MTSQTHPSAAEGTACRSVQAGTTSAASTTKPQKAKDLQLITMRRDMTAGTSVFLAYSNGATAYVLKISCNEFVLEGLASPEGPQRELTVGARGQNGSLVCDSQRRRNALAREPVAAQKLSLLEVPDAKTVVDDG